MLIYMTVPGLLLARTYAVSRQSQLVFGVLGFLILGNIIFGVVCLQLHTIMKAMNEGTLQFLGTVYNCNPTSKQANIISLSVPAQTFYKPILISSTDVKDLAFLFQFVSDANNQVGTLSGIITILFDTAVVAVTTFNTLAFLRLRKWVNVLKDQSLVGVLIQQGVNISLLLDVLLKAKKVWSDMGKSHFMLSFIHLNIVQVCTHSHPHRHYHNQGIVTYYIDFIPGIYCCLRSRY